MLIVVHQNDGVGLFAEILIIVGIVSRGQRNHELQPRSVHARRQLANKFAVMLLAGIRHLFEIYDDAGFVRLLSELQQVLRKFVPRRGVPEHFDHFLDVPGQTVVVV